MTCKKGQFEEQTAKLLVEMETQLANAHSNFETLENFKNIQNAVSTIKKDIMDRLNAIEDLYETLAARIHGLENKTISGRFAPSRGRKRGRMMERHPLSEAASSISYNYCIPDKPCPAHVRN